MNIKIYLTCILVLIYVCQMRSHMTFQLYNNKDNTLFEYQNNVFNYNLTNNNLSNYALTNNLTNDFSNNYAIKHLLGNQIDDLFDDNIDQINFLKSFGKLMFFFIGLQVI